MSARWSATHAAADILVVGESLMDRVDTRGTVREFVGGSPANVALGLGRLGHSVALLTQLARDARGLAIAAHLLESGVEVLPSSYVLERTSTALARIGPDGQARYDFDFEWKPFRPPTELRPRVVHTGSLACFIEPGARSTQKLLESFEGSLITFDPNVRGTLLGSRSAAIQRFEEIASLADVVKLSDEDAAFLLPGCGAEQAINEILALGPRMVVLTMGERGAVAALPDHRVYTPPVDVAAVDTIGAGDTFMASIVDSLLTRPAAFSAIGLVHVLQSAVRAAAITVSRPGADLPWRHELTEE